MIPAAGPPMNEVLIWSGVAAFGVVGSALCSGLEMGCYRVNRVALHVRAAAGPSRARVLRGEILRPDRLLGTLLVGNNLFNYLGILGVATVLERLGHGPWAVLAINTFVVTPLLLIIGESLPKEVFRIEADRLTYPLARSLRLMRWVFTATGVLPLVVWFGRAAARSLGAPRDAHGTDPRARITTLIKEGAAHGVLSESQTSLLDRAMTFRDIRAADQMTPWRHVVTLSTSWNHDRIVRELTARAHARYPVVGAGGRVEGVVHDLDLLLDPDAPLKSVMTPAVRIPAHAPLPEALAALQRAGAGLGIVEERGSPVGVVTMRDLTEPLIGEAIGDDTLAEA